MKTYNINELSKNEEGTGLSNVVSEVFKNKEKKSQVKFSVGWKIKSIDTLYLGWGDVKKEWKTYYYAMDSNWEVIFSKTQKSFLPLVTALLIKKGFKNPIESSKTTKVSDLMKLNVLEDDLQIDFTDMDPAKIPKRKINYKLWTLEVLNKLFSWKNEVFFPLDFKYKKVSNKSKEYDNPLIKKVHKFKKLMGNVMIDHPFESLYNFSLSSSNFNVKVDWHQPIVIETIDWKFYEAEQIRSKILIEEWKLRIPTLLAKIDKNSFKEFKTLNLISESQYDSNKIYTINLQWEGINQEDTMPLVNPKIKSIPQEEIVNLIADESYLAIKQTIYNKKEKELAEKLNLVFSYESSPYDKELFELWINSKGKFTPKIKDSTKTDIIPEMKVKTNIKIKLELTAKEKKSIWEDYLIELEKELNKISELDFVTKIDYDKKLLEIVQEKIKENKTLLNKKRFKLNLIKTAFFSNWLGMVRNLKFNEELIEKPNKIKNSFDWRTFSRTFSNKANTKTAKVQIHKTNEFE